MDLLILLLVVAGSSYIPIVGPFLTLYNTMIHESGHAIASLLTGGKVHKVKLFVNTEGIASTSNPFWIGRVITALMGYPFSSMVSVIGIWAIVHGYELFIAIGLGGFLLINALLWVRNVSGWIWLIMSMSLLSWLYLYQVEWFYTAIEIIVIMIWIQALNSSWVILVLSFKDSQNAGDASILSRMTLVPAVVWGGIFALQGVAFFIIGLVFISGGSIVDVINYSNNILQFTK